MEETERLYKDKINWKYVNYLRDKMTKYEDDGYLIHFFVRVDKHDCYFNSIYSVIYDKFKNYDDDYIFKELEKSYDRNGMYYTMLFLNKDAKSIEDTNIEIRNEFYNNVKHKSILCTCDNANAGDLLILKPEPNYFP